MSCWLVSAQNLMCTREDGLHLLGSYSNRIDRILQRSTISYFLANISCPGKTTYTTISTKAQRAFLRAFGWYINAHQHRLGDAIVESECLVSKDKWGLPAYMVELTEDVDIEVLLEGFPSGARLTVECNCFDKKHPEQCEMFIRILGFWS